MNKSAQQEIIANYILRNVSWAIRKGFNPFGFFKPIKNKISYSCIRAHDLLRHDITKPKDNDIISIGLQVKQLNTVGVFSRKPVTVQAKLGKIRQNNLRTFCLF